MRYHNYVLRELADLQDVLHDERVGLVLDQLLEGVEGVNQELVE